ncbi:MAG: hypothetical protein H8E13_19125 [Actinobacteria bacterium]|nr:hypothetical protein [Actinomycetota bacterium]
MPKSSNCLPNFSVFTPSIADTPFAKHHNPIPNTAIAIAPAIINGAIKPNPAAIPARTTKASTAIPTCFQSIFPLNSCNALANIHNPIAKIPMAIAPTIILPATKDNPTATPAKAIIDTSPIATPFQLTPVLNCCIAFAIIHTAAAIIAIEAAAANILTGSICFIAFPIFFITFPIPPPAFVAAPIPFPNNPPTNLTPFINLASTQIDPHIINTIFNIFIHFLAFPIIDINVSLILLKTLDILKTPSFPFPSSVKNEIIFSNHFLKVLPIDSITGPKVPLTVLDCFKRYFVIFSKTGTRCFTNVNLIAVQILLS